MRRRRAGSKNSCPNVSAPPASAGHFYQAFLLAVVEALPRMQMQPIAVELLTY